MSSIISPQSLSVYSKSFTKSQEAFLFLGITDVLVISNRAQKLLEIEEESNLILSEEKGKLYVKKSPRIEGQTWVVSKYKTGGFRISSTILCRFLRNKYQISGKDKARFFLRECLLEGFEIQSPTIIRKEASDV